MKYQGSCHCGAVKFAFEGDKIEQGLRCNCSLCQKKGATMTEYAIPPTDIKIEAEDGALSLYEFGDNVAKHYFCNRCGIYPFHQTKRMPNHYRMNVGCIDGIDGSILPFAVFDGQSLTLGD